MSYRTSSRALMAALCLASVTALAQVTPEEAKNIEEAAPARATRTPEHPRKLLVFTRTEGFVHDAIPCATKMLEVLGKKTGAWEIVESSDMAVFKPESLRGFDAVCFNNTTQLKFEDPELRRSLMDFVKGGKGIVGIHAATDNFYTWPEAAEMMGGTFDGHPWTSGGMWKVSIEDPGHPLMAAFEGKDFSISDEIYRTKTINLRKNARVLMGLDMKDEHNRKAGGVRNSDKDIPISWVRTFGKGRLFYCALGHNHDVYWNPAVMRHYLDGIQFALGDYPVETAPIPFNGSSFFDQNELGRLLKQVSSYTYGQSKQPLQDLDAFVRYVSDLPDARGKLEQQFLALLRSDATIPGKQFICSRLGLIGTGASVPTLTSMLADSATYDMALFALEYIPEEGVDVALCRILPGTQGRARVGVINALGRHRVNAAVPLLTPLAVSPDREIASAAVSALAGIASPEAAQVLSDARKTVAAPLLARVLDGYLRCAECFTADGDAARAMGIYKELYAKNQPLPVRLAALKGMVLLDQGHAGSLIVQAFQDEAPGLRSSAMQLVRDIRSTEGIRSIAAKLPSLSPAGQVQLLAALDDRRDPEVLHIVLGAVASKNSDVRIASYKTLRLLGDAGVVPVLARAAANAKGAEQKTAREALNGLSAPSVDDSIVALLARADARMSAELVASLGERRVAGSVPAVLRAATHRDAAVRAASAKALRVLAHGSDFPALLELLIQARGDEERKELEITVVAVAKKDQDKSKLNEAVLTACHAAKAKNVRVSLLTVLGKIGAPESLPLLEETLKDKDNDVRLCAIRALSGWPTSAPADGLWDIAQHASVPTHRALALRGFFRLLGEESERPAEQTLDLYKRALAMAAGPEEQRTLLASMADARVPAALQVAAGYLGDSRLRTDAELATVRIAENVIGNYQKEVVDPLNQVVKQSKNATAVQRAKELLNLAQRFDDFITTWEYAGPYSKAGARLFTTAFPPENSEASSVQWKLFPAGTNPEKPWLLQFDKVIGGDNRVVYLRNRIWSESARPALLELGSDDGIKVWLNGELVHQNDADRDAIPGDDKVPVKLKQGWNIVMMKVNQGTGEWGACARLRASDGSKLEGTRVALVQE